MRTTVFSLLLATVATVALPTGRVSAAEPAPAPEPAAVAAADELRDQGELAAAAARYRQALEQAPESEGAHRGLCLTLSAIPDERTDGLVECKKLVERHASPQNRAAYARALLAGAHGNYEVDRAFAQIEPALAQAPDDRHVLAAACQVMLERHSDRFDELAARLESHDVASLDANVYATLLHIHRREAGPAEASLERALGAGLDRARFEDLRDQIADLIGDQHDDAARARAVDEDRAPYVTAWRWMREAAVDWAVLLALVFIVGAALSAATSRQAALGPGQLRAEPTPGERTLRAIYRRVVVVAGVLFYLTVPLALLAVLGAGGFALYTFYEAGRIPVRLAAMIVLVMGATVSIVLRSLFHRPDDDDIGLAVEPARHPRLAALLEEVAREVGTRPVDLVFFRAGTDLGVFERGNVLGALGGHPQRCLVLGLGLLEGMTQDMFRVLLAHEYGHFRNQDTAGGAFALRVSRSLDHVLTHMAAAGKQRFFNPAYWVFGAFAFVFVRVSQGARRLQEVLADRSAAVAYGSPSFVRAYHHVIERSASYSLRVRALVAETEGKPRPLDNVFREAADAEGTPEFAEAVSAMVEASLARPARPTDSHPSARERLAWVERLGAPDRQHPHDHEPVASLVADLGAIERRVTAMLRSDLAIHANVVFHARPGAPQRP
jgi:Zn-dependent protease with chaperone function